MTYVLDYASIYLAIKNKVDPTPVESIYYIKKEYGYQKICWLLINVNKCTISSSETIFGLLSRCFLSF